MENTIYRKYGKRLFDLFISFFGMILLIPLYLIILIGLLLFQGKPIFYLQERAGYKGRSFIIYKFRTMEDKKDEYGNLLPDSARLTRMGKILRKLSLDELPELFNVIKGEMSIVGPRPLLLDYLSLYTRDQYRRHEVRPGITGLAQVNGRQLLPFSKRLDLDIKYVDNCSLSLDIKIVLLTLKKIITSEGVVLGQTVEEVDDIGISMQSRKKNKSRGTHDL